MAGNKDANKNVARTMPVHAILTSVLLQWMQFVLNCMMKGRQHKQSELIDSPCMKSSYAHNYVH